MLKHWLRNWLGLSADMDFLHKHLADLHDEMIGMRSDLFVTFRDELDPNRQAMSAKLGAKAIARLEDEDKARKYTTGEV